MPEATEGARSVVSDTDDGIRNASEGKRIQLILPGAKIAEQSIDASASFGKPCCVFSPTENLPNRQIILDAKEYESSM